MMGFLHPIIFSSIEKIIQDVLDEKHDAELMADFTTEVVAVGLKLNHIQL